MTTQKKTNSKKARATSPKNSKTAKPSLKESIMAKTIEELEEKVAAMESLIDEQQLRVDAAEEKMLRVVAEYENGKKRLERERDRSLIFAKERMVMGLLPILDNLERSAKYEQEHETPDTQQHGVQLVLDQLKKYLKDIHEVEAFDPQGETFDPELHEAMAMQPAEGVDSGIVIDVYEKGYRSGERVLRAAKVVVSQ